MSAQPKLLKSKFYWIALLYFTEGFPLGMFYDVFPVYFRQQGVELRDIGVLSLLGLAWTLKFLWAPAIDHYRRHRWWMAGADLCMGAVMLVFAMNAGFGPWVWLAIGAFTIFSATNDIAIDGYTIELLNRDELGLANGVRIGFYRVGMLASGVVLALSDWVQWPGAYLVVVGIFIASAIGVLCAPREQVRAVRVDRSRGLLHDLISQPLLAGGLAAFTVFVILLIVIEAVRKGLDFVWVFALGATEIGCLFLCAALLRAAARRHALQDIERSPLLAGLMELFSRPYILPTLAFILLFKLGDAAMGFMVKPFWVDAGFSATEIGLVSVNIGLALSIAGGVAGGWYTDRIGIFKALWVLGLFQALSNLGYA
ncbi:MAG TPA: MFS transporter, partial [Burkholderiales bacterium]